MSSTLIFGMRAYRLPPEIDGDTVLLFEEAAESNLFTASGGLVRRWGLRQVGSEMDVLVRVLEGASQCDTGMLKPDGKWTRAEVYYARAERAIRAATVDMDAWRMSLSLGAERVDRSLLEPGQRDSMHPHFQDARRWLEFVRAHPHLAAYQVAQPCFARIGHQDFCEP